MSSPGFRPVFIFLLSLLLNFSIIHDAFALTVSGVRFGTHPDAQRVVIELSEAVEFRAFVMAAPNRIVIDTPSFSWKVGQIQKPGTLQIKDVRFGDLGAGLSRIVIETGEPVVIQAAFMLPKQQGQLDRLVLDFKRTTSEAMQGALSQVHGPLQGTAPNVASPATSKPSPSASTPPPPASKKSAGAPFKPVIIIDPGHGGQDPGATAANGVYEKNITLAVGLELKRQLEESGNYRVKMTRSTDVFIPLRSRVQFARKNEGDLFISLHADSIRDNNVTGASVYTLSETASDAETAKLADRENKSDIIAGIDLSGQEADVANILLDLATRDTMNQSKFLANTVVVSLKSRNITLLERPHRSAGFAVLKAPDIPSILVEMGYLTNRSEVERLSSPEHRKKIAAALKTSIDGYFAKVSSLR
jgi:N-acetylmuramoyl-L-alanine amidase